MVNVKLRVYCKTSRPHFNLLHSSLSFFFCSFSSSSSTFEHNNLFVVNIFSHIERTSAVSCLKSMHDICGEGTFLLNFMQRTQSTAQIWFVASILFDSMQWNAFRYMWYNMQTNETLVKNVALYMFVCAWDILMNQILVNRISNIKISWTAL